jgi:hypothetical protein
MSSSYSTGQRRGGEIHHDGLHRGEEPKNLLRKEAKQIIASIFLRTEKAYCLGIIVFSSAREDFLQVTMPLSIVFLNANSQK